MFGPRLRVLSLFSFAFLILLAACSSNPENSGGPVGTTNPPGGGDPPGEGDPPEIPAECQRPSVTGFQTPIAMVLADLAEQAYDVDARFEAGDVVSTQSDCWELLKFIEYVDDGEWVDTQLFVAQNAHTKDIVVCFRGSQQDTDTWTDIAVAKEDWILDDGSTVPSSVHSGFRSGYWSVRDVLRSEILTALDDLEDPDARVYFTGHSLGGALATLAALDLATPIVDAGFRRDNVVLYSFGAPRSMTDRLTSHFESRVTNAHAVAILRDWVTHVPESVVTSNVWEHIDSMVLLHGSGNRTRIQEGPGSLYNGCLGVPIPLSFAHHGIALYRERLARPTVGDPSVGLRVAADGNLQLTWSTEAIGPCDWVGLYRGAPTDADDYLGIFSWQWAQKGSSYTTWWAKGDNYYAAYVDQFNQIVNVSEPYVPTTPNVWISRYDGTLSDWVQINWSVSDPGENDFIALYDRHPPTAGTNGYLTLQWQWALEGNSYATYTPWSGGYYVAYIMEDDDENRRMLAWDGPN